jgi:hypothetical protein
MNQGVIFLCVLAVAVVWVPILVWVLYQAVYPALYALAQRARRRAAEERERRQRQAAAVQAHRARAARDYEEAMAEKTRGYVTVIGAQEPAAGVRQEPAVDRRQELEALLASFEPTEEEEEEEANEEAQVVAREWQYQPARGSLLYDSEDEDEDIARGLKKSKRD